VGEVWFRYLSVSAPSSPSSSSSSSSSLSMMLWYITSVNITIAPLTSLYMSAMHYDLLSQSTTQLHCRLSGRAIQIPAATAITATTSAVPSPSPAPPQ
jgi:hypothetical protein